jgi:hypothetical protein
MAQTTYVSKVAVSLATREIAYAKLMHFLGHLHGWDLNLLSIVRRPDNFIEVTLNNPIPGGVAQLDHLGIESA